ncbi:MAG TPA: hypothetical protein VM347_35605, partial [Nonomuraea sp.]|nr:hypothetical protein [Nonomuraea sp.]
MAVISGPIGSGGNRLARAFADHAADEGALVLTATCSKAERTIALGVVNQWFLGHGTGQTPEVERALELLGEHMFELNSGDESLGLRQSNAKLIHALAQILLEMARHRLLVIVVED